MYKVLLVEDSETCRIVATRALTSPEIELTIAETLAEAKQILNQNVTFDLIVLDLILPDGEGLSLFNVTQPVGSATTIPTLLLTNKDDLASKVLAFSLGAEDYLVKPINPVELKARVEMRLRKVGQKKRDMETLRLGGITINIPMMKASVRRNDEECAVELTAKEFKILAFLAQNEGKLFSRDDLMKTIWGDSTHVVSRTIDSHVCGLRKKLKPYSSYIKSIPSAGYKLVVSPK